jgi:hypothetical protein
LGSTANSKLVDALKIELDKVLEPKLPRVNLTEVLADVSAQIWMAGFDGLVSLEA